MKTITFYNQFKKHFLLFFIAFLGTQIVQSQTTPEVLWAKRFGGPNTESASDMVIDASENIYMVGTFSSETTFGDITLTASNGGASFVAKTDSSGNVLWAKQFSNCNARGITTDNLGNVYVAGNFLGTVTFDSFTLNSGNSPDVFVLKQDASGNVLWVTHFGGTNISDVQSIVADSQGSAYTIGYFYENITLGNITISSEQQTRSYFIAKQDTSGNVLWAKKIGQTDFISVEKITIDTSDNIYVLGDFDGTIDFDGTTFIASEGYQDFFLVKLNSLGQTIWGKQFEVTTSYLSDYYAEGITIDVMNNVYITGSFRGTLQAGTITLTSSGAENRDMFVVKIDSLGETLWAKEFACSYLATNVGITTDTLGKVYVTGYFYGTIDFDGIVLAYSFHPSAPPWRDAFVLKIDDLGNVEWAVKYGALGDDLAKSIAIDPEGNVLVLGTFNFSVYFNGTVLTSVANSQDIFLLKLSPNALTTEKKQINKWSVFPNPVSDFLILNFSDYSNTSLSVEVFTILGQKIKVFENLNTAETLDLSDLTSGVYLLKVSNNEITQSIKIKKQ